MSKKSVTIKLEEDRVQLLNDAADEMKITKTDIISRGIPLAIVWQRAKDVLPMPKKLIFNEKRGVYQAEADYRKEFFAKFVELAERSIAIP